MKRLAVICLLAFGCGEGVLESSVEIEQSIEDEMAFPGRTGELETSTFRMFGVDQQLTYQVIDDQMVFDGDMILGEVLPFSPNALSVVGDTGLWPAERIPYELASSLSETQRNQVLDAIAHWHDNTTINFVPRRSEAAFVEIRNVSSGCSASVGYNGGRQRVNISSACTTGAIIHELGHTVGLWHTHQRADRDDHVRIDFDRIIPSARFNFNIASPHTSGSYDVNSIMHYSSFAFARRFWEPAMTTINGGLINPQRDRLTGEDLNGIRRLYDGSPVGELSISRRNSSSFWVGGWAIDPDTHSSIRVDVYVNGQFKKQGNANIWRPDILERFHEFGGNHGMWFHVPGRSGQTACAYALDVGRGSNTELGCKRIP